MADSVFFIVFFVVVFMAIIFVMAIVVMVGVSASHFQNSHGEIFGMVAGNFDHVFAFLEMEDGNH